jgi:hypothetical protein
MAHEGPAGVHIYETFSFETLTRLLDRDLFGAFLDLFLLGKEKLQDTIVILGLDRTGVDPVIQVKAAFKALERKFFTDGLVIFSFVFFFLFKPDDQLTAVDRQFEVFFGPAGSGEFQMIGLSGLMDVHGRKTKAFFAAHASRETLKELIYEIRQALVAVVVYFYECHIQFFFVLFNLFDAKGGSNDIPSGKTALFPEKLTSRALF